MDAEDDEDDEDDEPIPLTLLRSTVFGPARILECAEFAIAIEPTGGDDLGAAALVVRDRDAAARFVATIAERYEVSVPPPTEPQKLRPVDIVTRAPGAFDGNALRWRSIRLTFGFRCALVLRWADDGSRAEIGNVRTSDAEQLVATLAQHLVGGTSDAEFAKRYELQAGAFVFDGEDTRLVASSWENRRVTEAQVIEHFTVLANEHLVPRFAEIDRELGRWSEAPKEAALTAASLPFRGAAPTVWGAIATHGPELSAPARAALRKELRFRAALAFHRLANKLP